jgi:hypothetical protein
MKLFNNKFFWIIASLPVAASFSGCKKFLDVNTDPNNLTASKAQYLITGALNNTARNQVTSSIHVVVGGWSGLYGHSTSYTGGGNEKTYVVTNNDFDWWSGVYDNIYDFQKVIERADADGVGFWKDPAMVMECYNYARLVDTYGDIPFTDAVHDVANLSPKYTNAKDVYDSLIVRLDQAMANMQNATWPAMGTLEAKQDIYFGLNKTDWIHFANTLKLRLLLHQDFMGDRDAYIVSNIQSTAALGYLDKNVLCQPGYAVSSGKLNPYYSTYGYNESNTVQGNHQYRKMNKVIIQWLKSTNDDYRLQGLAWPDGAQVTAPLPTWPSTASSYSYDGVPFGAGSGAATGNSSAMGPFYIQKGVTGSATGPLVVFTLAESKLLQAEAVQKYPALSALGDPKTLYEAGVQAHFRLVRNMCYTAGVTNIANNAANAEADAAFAAYIAQPIENVNWDASTDKLRAILVQKWVAFTHINGLEAWTDYRKSSVTKVTGHTYYSIPLDPRSQTAASSTDEPLRMLYPQIEFITNGNNVPKGIDQVQSSPIFWDANN